ncbi:type II toxin-antitoxin system PemK/MazF family toxin [Paucisalibacillus sp. EB02]|uniref:type II toxin-antitoxin system PemK/MazF family toxin n=1 Tax=Paucisalibacillus sp. EB02 TaxID=1347087 RepID=UPI0004B9A653|nr:type II toxin-antitoxin system PemK/MazF family toxin [Paucisalibacillus sp. EB02]
MRRRINGEETWYRLRDWTKGQAASERLGSHILASEGFESIDPSHPLGGPDGTKDFICIKNGLKWIGACYFPRGQKEFNEVKKKFIGDLEGIEKNKVDGLAFITNQELSVGNRETLKGLSKNPVEIYHLERLTQILNKTENYGVRLEYLDIEITTEEQLAFFALFTNKVAESEKKYEKKISNLSKAYQMERKIEQKRTTGVDSVEENHQPQEERKEKGSEIKEAKLNRKILNRVKKGAVFFADLGAPIGYEQAGTRPVIIVSNNINNKYSPTVTVIPVTGKISKTKLPTHVDLGNQLNPKFRSIGLVEQIKTIDKRNLLKFITFLNRSIMSDVEKAIKIQLDL